jgi:hypothetical protein
MLGFEFADSFEFLPSIPIMGVCECKSGCQELTISLVPPYQIIPDEMYSHCLLTPACKRHTTICTDKTIESKKKRGLPRQLGLVYL